MDSPLLTGRNRVQAALLLLVTALVVTSGCVGLLNDPDESQTETLETPQTDQSATETPEQSDTDDAASVETQAADEETPSDSGDDGTDTSDGSENSAGNGAATDSGSDAEPLLSYVPASADTIVTVDPSILTQESTITLANGSESTDEWNYSDLDAENHSLFDSTAETADVSSYLEAIDLYEAQLGINVSEVHSVTYVTEQRDGSRESKHHDGVAIVDTDLTWATVRDAIAQSDRIEGEFAERSYGGVKLYQVPKNGSAYDGTHTQEIWVADFGNGVFAVGSQEQVETVIDTRQGESAAVSGALREEAAAAEGLVTAVVNTSTDRSGTTDGSIATRLGADVETTVVEYAPEGETVRLNATFVAVGTEEARQIGSMLSIVLAGSQWIDDPEKAAIAEEIFEATTVETMDTRVQVEFEMDAERINALVERAEALEEDPGAAR